MTTISGLGEGEQLTKSVVKHGLGDGERAGRQMMIGVQVGDLVAAGDSALAASGAGGVARKRSAVSGGIASAAAALSPRRPGLLISLVDM
jgi:hypothetical protein